MTPPSFVRPRDIKTVIRAVEAAGKAVTGVRVSPDGTIELLTAPAAPSPPEEDTPEKALADFVAARARRREMT